MEINFMDKGYILHNGVLKSYELLEISICFSTDIIRYKCLIGGKEERLCEAPMTYRSEEEYRLVIRNDTDIPQEIPFKINISFSDDFGF